MPNPSSRSSLDPSAPSADPLALCRQHREIALEYLQQAVNDLAEKIERKGDGLAAKLLSARFYDDNPLDRIHAALTRAEGLAELLCQLHEWQQSHHVDFSPEALAATAGTLRHEVRDAKVVFVDFWQNGGGLEAWRERQEEGARDAAA